MTDFVALTDWAWLLGLIGLGTAAFTYSYVKKQDPGTEVMIDLGEQIHDGAMAFLGRVEHHAGADDLAIGRSEVEVRMAAASHEAFVAIIDGDTPPDQLSTQLSCAHRLETPTGQYRPSTRIVIGEHGAVTPGTFDDKLCGQSSLLANPTNPPSATEDNSVSEHAV